MVRSGHATNPIGVLFHRRQRHGAVRTGLAIFRHRAGADGDLAVCRGTERHQLQHRTQFWACHRRHRRGYRRRGRGLCGERGALYPAADRAVSVAPQQRAVAAATRAPQPRHRVGRALHRQFALDTHRAGAHFGDRGDRGFGIGADAAGSARLAARRRANLRIMLGAFGMGAVIGALNITEVRKRMSGEAAVRACALSMGGAIAAVGLSREPVLTAAALVIAGAVWMLSVALFNIGVQLSAPPWVAGRSLAAFQASLAGGIAIGSWGWGRLTDVAGVETALLVSAGLLFAGPLLGLWLGMPRVGARNEDAEVLADPEVRLSLTGRSGPLVVEIEYRAAQDNARPVHNVMHEVQLSRHRHRALCWAVAPERPH